MPLYEYRCDDCGADFEEVRRITDEHPPPCPQCESGNVHRLISQTSFVLKGSGWYVTDYAKKGASGSAEVPPPGGNGDTALKADKPEEKKEAASEARPAPEKKGSEGQAT